MKKKKIVSILLVLGILVNIIIPLSTVFADDDLHYVFKFEVENTNKYEIARDDNLDLIVSIKGTEDVIYLDVIAI